MPCGTVRQFVPYRGSAPAPQDLVAGQIDLMFDNPITPLPHVRAGSIKAYAVTGKTRLATAPNILTADEAGLSGFYAGYMEHVDAAQAPKQLPYMCGALPIPADATEILPGLLLA